MIVIPDILYASIINIHYYFNVFSLFTPSSLYNYYIAYLFKSIDNNKILIIDIKKHMYIFSFNNIKLV